MNTDNNPYFRAQIYMQCVLTEDIYLEAPVDYSIGKNVCGDGGQRTVATNQSNTSHMTTPILSNLHHQGTSYGTYVGLQKQQHTREKLKMTYLYKKKRDNLQSKSLSSRLLTAVLCLPLQLLVEKNKDFLGKGCVP